MPEPVHLFGIELFVGSEYRREREPLTHLVAYVPRGAPYLCVEPVSHVANGFNLAAAGVEDTGTHVLEPGATLDARASLEWEPARRTCIVPDAGTRRPSSPCRPVTDQRPTPTLIA